MSSDAQLPHLLKLLDDESPEIRNAIAKELSAYGPELESKLIDFQADLSSEQHTHLSPLIVECRRSRLRRLWPLVFAAGDDCAQIESAYTLLAEYQNGPAYAGRVGTLLDDLAVSFRRASPRGGVPELSCFLFATRKLRGATANYYHPANSDLVYVLEQKRGVPISLVAVMMLAGRRCGLTVEGCNFPGHFLARHRHQGVSEWIDCYNHGRRLRKHEIRSQTGLSNPDTDRLLDDRVPAAALMERVLRNLIKAYQHVHQRDHAEFFMTLLKRHGEQNAGSATGTPAVPVAVGHDVTFKPGTVVAHRRYGYRGVVVDFDTNCQAREMWYQSNQTQPDKDQAWYYVLVDNAEYNTYAAQNSLRADDTGGEIHHPLVAFFFSGFEDGAYVRNDRKWPRHGQ